MKRRIVHALAAAATAAMSFTAVAPVASADTPSVADQVGPSLVYITTEYTARVQIPYTTGNEWSPELTVTGSCTGYIVDPAGYIATAGHCVDVNDPSLADAFRQQVVVEMAKAQNRSTTWAQETYALAQRNEWPIRGVNQSDNTPDRYVAIRQPNGPERVFSEWTTAQVLNYQKFDDGDNAVLKVNSATGDLPALRISAEVPEPGDTVTSIGFPGAVQRTNDTTALAQPSFKAGTVSSRQVAQSGIARTEVSAVMGQGMSGGPTVDETGAVIGTNSSGSSLIDEKASFNFITDNVALRSYLQSNGVTLAVATEAGSSLNMWVWLGPLIGVVVVLLILLVVLLVRRGKKKKNSGGGFPPQGPGSFGGSPNPFGGPQGGPGSAPNPYGTPGGQAGPFGGPQAGSGASPQTYGQGQPGQSGGFGQNPQPGQGFGSPPPHQNPPHQNPSQPNPGPHNPYGNPGSAPGYGQNPYGPR